MDSYLRELRKRAISAASLSSEDVDENNLLKGTYSFRKSRVLLTERLQKEMNSVDFNGVFSALFIARNKSVIRKK